MSLLLTKVKVSSTYLNQMVGRAPLFITPFSSKSHIKILAKTGPKGDPMARGTRQGVIQLKSSISLKLGTNVGFGE